ncbi:Uncharacterized conserved protein YutE, UPF0331/DUF86 family [Thermanaeromonas toyohensis ToBE]|uniref:Uncharacterized conserved protein YutE, UPF0331/DUF86 family n=1 Tax=Thermanaeromonas toyohensis ToBE TaxID=698762 RepID=A0A1W1VYQ1_9FIRM|nr:DUF86 domain-containing protein [Thermanaeromonas toyohensis]SMB98241.1 Uncharacterized conserved protein YutE, UPF0331/DUF86 family [Thermanaeromonas toyohensis ToBE]
MAKKELYLNYDLLREKMADIEKAVALLEKIASKSLEEFLSDEMLISGAKYQLIVAIEAAQSICNHLAARVAKEAPASYADCFYILRKNSVISEEIAQKMASAAKFRNLLVHQYGKINDYIVFDVLRKDLGNLLRYIGEIKSFLKAVEKEQEHDQG